jgi:hypothetical protein
MMEKDQMSSASSTAGNTFKERDADAALNNNFLAVSTKNARDASENSSIADVDPESEQQVKTAEEGPRDITGWKWAAGNGQLLFYPSLVRLSYSHWTIPS